MKVTVPIDSRRVIFPLYRVRNAHATAPRKNNKSLMNGRVVNVTVEIKDMTPTTTVVTNIHPPETKVENKNNTKNETKNTLSDEPNTLVKRKGMYTLLPSCHSPAMDNSPKQKPDMH